MTAYRRYLRELVARSADDRADDFASAMLGIHDEDPEALSQ
jgi:cytochrome P450